MNVRPLNAISRTIPRPIIDKDGRLQLASPWAHSKSDGKFVRDATGRAYMTEPKEVIVVQKPLPPFKCVVIEGGGVRGAAYGGAYKVFSKYGLTKNVEHVAGSSVGAIASLLFSLGYTKEEVDKELSTLPIAEFIERPDLLAPTWLTRLRLFKHIFSHQRVSTGQAMQTWLEDRIEQKLGKRNATFADLAAHIQSAENANHTEPMKYLYVAATNIEKKIPEKQIFSHHKTPNVALATAVRASGTFPYFFEPVAIDTEEVSGKFVDGGAKSNLPADSLDRTWFTPDDFGFTDKGKNPGILVLKIDSKDEINQVIWGIAKKRKLETISDYTAAIGYAFTDTVDVGEMRKSRMVLALPDTGVQMLNFTIDRKGTRKLVSAAEDTTQEFLENMIGGAYDVKTYNTSVDWFDSLSLDELYVAIAQYKQMLSSAPATTLTTTQTHNPLEFDASQPNKADIQRYIDYIQRYINYRIAKISSPNLRFEHDPHIPHINLPIEPCVYDWEKALKADMEQRIEVMKKQMSATMIDINNVIKVFSDTDQDGTGNTKNKSKQSVLLHDQNLCALKQLAAYQSYYDILKDEVADLEMKLGVRKVACPPDEQLQRYGLLGNQLNQDTDNDDASSAMQTIVKYIDYLNPILNHKSSNAADNGLFSYNLRNKTHGKLCLIAIVLYLEHHKAKEAPVYRHLFETIFAKRNAQGDVTKKATFPTSMALLANAFSDDGNADANTADNLTRAYRIEELLSFFARSESQDPTQTMNLDRVFASYNGFFAKALSKLKSHHDGCDGTQLTTFVRARKDDGSPESTSRRYRMES